MTINLSGHVGLVTGASSGLGRQLATTMARAGVSVMLAARRLQTLNEIADRLLQEGLSAAAVELDLRDVDAIKHAVDVAESRFGIVDILINSAGVPDAGYATRLPLETIDRVIDVNFRAPFLMSTEIARRLISAGKPGNIVNIASVGAYHYTPTTAAALYCATKSGLIRMTEVLALEWARFGINVNAIAPGLFKSEMNADFLERAGADVKNDFPRGRVGEPEYFDSTLLYLLSPSSHFVTGTCIVVDDAQFSR
jgi:NAD(P)-dependent dehydrogenase (short-subunit alcohol dehydrogenase family)